MNQTLLNGTDLMVSRLALGTASMGTGLDEKLSFDILDHYLSDGGNFVDTANIYGRWTEANQPRSEQLIGDWMKQRGNRNRVILATKGCHFTLKSPQISRVTAEAIHEDVLNSLSNLRTDHIDLYYLHRDNPDYPVGLILSALETEVKAGRIRWYAASNWRQDRLEEAAKWSRENGCKGFVTNQISWSLADPNPEPLARSKTVAMDSGLEAWHLFNHVPVVAYSSQAKGYFSKCLLPGFDTDPALQEFRINWDSPENRARAERVKKLSIETGIEPTDIALLWMLSRPVQTIPIVGANTVDRWKKSLHVLSLNIPAEQLNGLY